jgi:hypothetical protein
MSNERTEQNRMRKKKTKRWITFVNVAVKLKKQPHPTEGVRRGKQS